MTEENQNPMPVEPEEVNTFGIRMKNGLKKGLLWAGIAGAVVLGLGLYGAIAGGTAILGSGIWGWVASALGLGAASATGFLGTAATWAGALAIGIPTAAGLFGFLLGSMDDAPVREAQADAERDFRRQQMRAMESQRMALMARRQSMANQQQMAMMGLGGEGISTPMTPQGAGFPRGGVNV